MKNIILLFFCSLLFVQPASSQEGKNSFHKYLSVGPTVGFGHCWTGVKYEDFFGEDHKAKSLFNASALAGISLVETVHPHWGWGIDFLASSEGYRLKEPHGDNNADNALYLRINPKVYYFFNKINHHFKPKIFLGPSVGIGLENYSIINGKITDSPYPRHFDFVDIGLNAGVGFNYNLTNNLELSTDVSYYHGFKPLYWETNFNNNLRCNIGLLFRVGGRI